MWYFLKVSGQSINMFSLAALIGVLLEDILVQGYDFENLENATKSEKSIPYV
jgi:hypothetical protein